MVICLLGDGLRPIIITTVDNAVACDSNVFPLFNFLKLVIVDESIEQQIKSIVLVLDNICHLFSLVDGLAATRVGELRWWGSETADLRVRDLAGSFVLFCGVNRDFDRAGAGVDCENNLHHEIWPR